MGHVTLYAKHCILKKSANGIGTTFPNACTVPCHRGGDSVSPIFLCTKSHLFVLGLVLLHFCGVLFSLVSDVDTVRPGPSQWEFLIGISRNLHALQASSLRTWGCTLFSKTSLGCPPSRKPPPAALTPDFSRLLLCLYWKPWHCWGRVHFLALTFTFSWAPRCCLGALSALASVPSAGCNSGWPLSPRPALGLAASAGMVLVQGWH